MVKGKILRFHILRLSHNLVEGLTDDQGFTTITEEIHTIEVEEVLETDIKFIYNGCII